MSRRALSALVAVLVVGCSGGRDKTLADLQSARPEVRALAVKRLAERFEAEDVSLFSQLARDPVSIVRAEAMTALGKTQDSRIVDLLGEGLADPDEQVQQAAAAALASFKTDKARSYLTLQYSRRGRTTRMAIVQALKGTNIPGAMASVVVAEAKAIWDRNMKVLNDGSLPERIGAAEELGRSGRPEAVNRLVPLLKDKHVGLAAAAARGLGLARDPRAAPAVTALLDENYPELREAACEALGRLGETSALPKLLAVAQEKSPTSPFATRAILALPRSPEVDKALCSLVVSANDAEVLSTGRELRKRGGCPVEPIIELLKSPATVNAGLLAIIALAPRGELVPKVGALTTASDEQTRRLAIEALAELNDPAGAAFVQKAWDAELKSLEPRRLDWIPAELPTTYADGFDPTQAPSPDDPFAVARARTSELFGRVQQLDAQRAKEAGKTLLEARAPREILDDAAEDEVRVLASILRALGKLKVEGAKVHGQAFVRETSPSLRGAAYSALAFLGEDARPGLFDAERSVQGTTAQALAESGPKGQLVVLQAISELAGDRTRLIDPLRGLKLPPEAAPKLEQLAKEGGSEAGASAVLLGEMDSKSSIPVLLALLDDQEAVARRDVLHALGRLGDPRAADAIGRDLYSDSAEVRSAAARALAQLKVPAQLEAIDALKGDYDLQVRNSATAAVEALAPDAPEGKR
ncbi:MAG: HEAT repeat domain-containing protein [Archangium sp.]|nr:HEAT repeat domain-containing protein [Archangium sp.]MDP3153865.1 HEAT repeat domain-containing protein [Archangium sp.]MDP3569978.1 HEAT repeat domain-containing protein [Archangium sp.]